MKKGPLILGVTGNIAAGKSTITQGLKRRGAVVVDADLLSREVVATGTKALKKLVNEFGSDILKGDGSLDRDRLGQMVFADTQVRATLNRIVHPEIARRSVEELQRLKEEADAPLIVYEAPLLFEVGAETRVDKVLVVTIDPEEQLARLMKRDGLDQVAAKQRIAAQMSQEEKVKRADYVIDNTGTPEKTRSQIDLLWPHILVGE